MAPPSIGTSIRVILAVALPLGLAACQGVSDKAWSTKGDSALGARASHVELGATADAGAAALPVAADGVGLREAAVDLLLRAAEAADPLLRANAIEALHHAPERVEAAAVRGLGDPNRGVRFIAAMTIGDFRLHDAVHLLYPLLDDESGSVRAAAIYGLRRCGQDVDPSPLAKMVTGSDPEEKANAAVVLGKLGNPSAVPLLRSAVGRGMSRVSPARARVVDLQIAEAMVLLGDDRQLDVVRAALFAPAAEQGEIVALACLIAGRIGDERTVPTLLDFATRTGDRRLPAEVRMAATIALASLDLQQAPIAVALEFANHQRPALRAQAALTLGAIPDQQSITALRRLLADNDPLVQVSAAAGVLKALGG